MPDLSSAGIIARNFKGNYVCQTVITSNIYVTINFTIIYR